MSKKKPKKKKQTAWVIKGECGIYYGVLESTRKEAIRKHCASYLSGFYIWRRLKARGDRAVEVELVEVKK